MADTLTQLIEKVQDLLLDDGTRFTTATVTAAIRQALKEFNQAAPVNAGTLIDAVASQYEYVLDAADFAGLLDILGIWRDDGNEIETQLAYDFYWEDNEQVIRLAVPQAAGTANLIARFTKPNTISGLDSEAESTIPAYFDQVIVDGAAYYSICIRSAGRVETINLNNDVPDNLREAAATYLLAFMNGKGEAGRQRPKTAQVSGWAK